MTKPLLEIDRLDVVYPGRRRADANHVLKDVSIRIPSGSTLGLVGESGSGKTTLGRAVLGLAPVTSGSVKFAGEEIGHLSHRRRRALARDIQVVFQDPYSSLNPSMSIESILSEPLQAAGLPGVAARRRVRELLDQVGLPSDAARRLPREFSGGQRQRVAIARALALDPKLIVCDEPVSALDLSTQALVLDLLIDIQERTGVAYLFISHDLAVVRHISHEVAVMYRGQIVEEGEVDKVTGDPEHPYTRRLLLAAPVPHPARQAQQRANRLRFEESLRRTAAQALREPENGRSLEPSRDLQR